MQLLSRPALIHNAKWTSHNGFSQGGWARLGAGRASGFGCNSPVVKIILVTPGDRSDQVGWYAQTVFPGKK
jgi:hypothetical protein